MILHAGESIIGYDDYGGNGAGQATLVLLHAFPLSRGQWRAQGEALAREGIRVIAPDLRGFGESSVQVGPITVDEMAADVRGLLDALDIHQVILGGLSLGGYVAFAAVRQFPHRIKGLVLADTRASADSAGQRAAREETSRLANAQGPVAILERDLPRLLTEQTRAKHPWVVETARNLARVNSDIGVSAAALGMALRPDSTDRLAHIRIPTLIIVGDEDAITPRADAFTMFDALPEAHMAVVPQAGHLSNLEQPDRFTSHLAHFLERWTRAPQRQHQQANA